MSGTEDVGFFHIQKLVRNPVQRATYMGAFVDIAFNLVIASNDKHGKPGFPLAKDEPLAADGGKFLQRAQVGSPGRIFQGRFR